MGNNKFIIKQYILKKKRKMKNNLLKDDLRIALNTVSSVNANFIKEYKKGNTENISITILLDDAMKNIDYAIQAIDSNGKDVIKELEAMTSNEYKLE